LLLFFHGSKRDACIFGDFDQVPGIVFVGSNVEEFGSFLISTGDDAF
jgi:hypothetical protein